MLHIDFLSSLFPFHSSLLIKARRHFQRYVEALIEAADVFIGPRRDNNLTSMCVLPVCILSTACLFYLLANTKLVKANITFAAPCSWYAWSAWWLVIFYGSSCQNQKPNVDFSFIVDVEGWQRDGASSGTHICLLLFCMLLYVPWQLTDFTLRELSSLQ